MALAELRNLSATSFFRSTAAILPVLGGNSSFTASVLLRELGPTSSTQWICGNVNGSSGWSFVRTSDSNSGATHNFTFTVYENAVAQTLSFAIPGSVGKMMLFHLAYAGGAPGSLTIYVNGIEIITGATSSDAITVSTGVFSIGYDLNGAAQANTDMGFVSFAYTNTTFTSQEIAENTQAIIKLQDISDNGLPSRWQFLYSVCRDSGSGIPSVLRNFGTLTTTLTVVGRTSMILSAPPSFLGDSVRLQSSGGGGDVSGPGASTNNAVATWDGILGDTLQNSVVTIAPVSGNISTPGTVDGRDISVDGTKLDTIATGATATPLSAVVPVNVTKAAAAVGVATTAARSDHKHDISTAAAGTIAVGDTAAEGTATTLTRSDHRHALPAPAAPVNVTKSAASAGVATTVARADHKHDVTTAAAVSITSSTNSEGTATSLARSDHTHAHGNLSGGTLHAVATDSTAGFMSAADKTKLDNIPGGSTADIYEIFVSAANGDDANDGATALTAVATLARAWELIPTFPTQGVLIHVGSGSYTWTDLTTVRQNQNAPIYVWGDGAGQPGDDGFNTVATGTIAAGTTTTVLNTGAALPSTNLYAGYTISVNGFLQELKHIRSNTTTSITLNSKLSSVPPNGTAFQIKESDIQIVLPAGANIGAGTGYSQSESPLVLINLRFSAATPGFDGSLRVSSCHLVCYGLSFDEGALTCVDSMIHAGTLYANANDPFGAFGNFLPLQGTVDPLTYLIQQLPVIADGSNNFNWEGWGLSCLRDTDEQLPLVMDSGQFVGFLVGSQLTVSANSKVTLVGGSIIDNGQTTSGQIINNGGYLYIQGTTTQRNDAGVINSPGVEFTVVTGAAGKLGILTQAGGYTRVDTLTFSTNAASSSWRVTGVGSAMHLTGTGTGVTNSMNPQVLDGAVAFVEGTFSFDPSAVFFIDGGQCVFDGPAGQCATLTLTNQAALSVTSTGVFHVTGAVGITHNSTLLLQSYIDFDGAITVTDSTVNLSKTSALTTADFGSSVTATNSEIVLAAYPNTMRINNGGSATATVLTLTNSKLVQSGFAFTITGRVSLSNDSEWLASGSTGTTACSRLTCTMDSRVLFNVTGVLSVIDSAAPSLSLTSSKFLFTGTTLTIGNSTAAECILQDSATMIVSTTGVTTVAGNITAADSSISVSDCSAFTVNRSVALENCSMELRNLTAGTISTGFVAKASKITQSICPVDITDGVLLSRGSTWTAIGALGATCTWDGSATGPGLALSEGAVFDMTLVTSGSFVFDANATLTPVTITTGAVGHFLSDDIAITGSPTEAAMVLTFGGAAYFTGAVTGFTASGDDFHIDTRVATAAQINTHFTTLPGAPYSDFATPGTPSLIQYTAFVMRIS